LDAGDSCAIEFMNSTDASFRQEGLPARCCHTRTSIPPSFLVVKAVQFANEGRQNGLEMAICLLKFSSGGDYEDLARAIGEQLGRNPALALHLASHYSLLPHHVRSIATTLPESVVDDDRGRCLLIEQRIDVLLAVEATASVETVRQTALLSLIEYMRSVGCRS
jgi:hypothetical protein